MTVQLRRLTFALLVLPFILTACDSGSSEPGDDIAPTAMSATATGETLTITFDEPVDPASVRASAFTVTDEGRSLPVAGAKPTGPPSPSRSPTPSSSSPAARSRS